MTSDSGPRMERAMLLLPAPECSCRVKLGLLTQPWTPGQATPVLLCLGEGGTGSLAAAREPLPKRDNHSASDTAKASGSLGKHSPPG